MALNFELFRLFLTSPNVLSINFFGLSDLGSLAERRTLNEFIAASCLSPDFILDIPNLAELYGVETKFLVRAVKRNLSRFPADFMFQLNQKEFENLRFHFGTSSQWGGRRYFPYAFTEQGVAMLSSVLNSERAVEVNIQSGRVFVKLRKMIASHKDLSRRLYDLEKKYDARFKVVFEAIRELMRPPKLPVVPKKKIGFELKERQARYTKKGGSKVVSG